MTRRNGTTVNATVARNEVRDIAVEVGALEGMTTKELQARFLEVFGETARSRNRTYLQKRIAFMIQAKAEPLSAASLDKIEALAATTPVRQRPPRAKVGETTTTHQVAAKVPEPASDRDPRLPPVGSTITKVYRGETHEVLVLAQGFSYRGEHFRSLSALARKITNTIWSGMLFFGLTDRPAKKGAAK